MSIINIKLGLCYEVKSNVMSMLSSCVETFSLARFHISVALGLKPSYSSLTAMNIFWLKTVIESERQKMEQTFSSGSRWN